MSAGLAAGVEQHSLDGCLAEIDARTRGSQGEAHPVHVTAGPFGVLDLGSTSSIQVETTHSDVGHDIQSNADPVEATTPADYVQIPLAFTLESFSSLDQSLSWDDLFDIDMEGMTDALRATDDGNGSFFWSGVTDTSPDSTRRIPEDIAPAPVTTSALPTDLPQGAPHLNQRTMTDPDAVPIEDAQLLLQHFRKNLASITCAPPIGQKSPWEILHLTSAVQTLADTTFLWTTKVTHARKANYYGVLSCAALHLLSTRGDLGDRSPDYIESLASRTLTRATHHMQRSLKSELSGPSKAKYKDQLMAILVLMTRSVSASGIPIHRVGICRLMLRRLCQETTKMPGVTSWTPKGCFDSED